MATKKKTVEDAYVSHAVPKEITATSRCSIKIKENFYTIETMEKREITNTENIDMEKEWKMLFDEINTMTDDQVQEIVRMFEKKS